MPKSSVEQLRDNLTEIEDIKGQIRQAIIAKETEVPLDTPFSEYPQKIEDIQTKEDLDDVLNTQDEKIAELEAALENKTAGGKVKLNIFTQTTEPTNKNGLWLQTNKTAEHYKSDDSIYFGGSWSNSGDTANIPYNFYKGAAVNIGENIYIFGGYDSDAIKKYAYKYDTLTNTYTKLANIPFNFFGGSIIVINTDIYLFGGDGSLKAAYKYDTLTNMYTQLANIPFNFTNGGAEAVGTDIYLFGGTYEYDAYNYKYDTLTNTYTRLANIPFNFAGGSAVIGDTIYMFGSPTTSPNYTQYAYKYNTSTNTYTRLTNIPYPFYYSPAVVVGTDIYLFGAYSGQTSYRKNAYKYSTTTDTYTKLTNIPYDFYNGAATAVGTDIYLLGGEGSKTSNRIYHIQTKTYNTDNTVIIAQGRAGIGKTYNSGYAVELFDTTFDENFQPLYGLVDAWFYTITDGVITTIPTYYGDGTHWIKFKN